jgi:hypothetical protein
MCRPYYPPQKFGQTWRVTTGICDDHYGCTSVLLICDQPNSLPKLNYTLNTNAIVPMQASHVRSSEYIIIFEFMGFQLPVQIGGKKIYSIVSRPGCKRIINILERRLQDFNIYGNVYEFAIYSNITSKKAVFMPRRLLVNETLIAGYQHFEKYIVHARVISMRLWNHTETREFIHRETNRAVNHMRRDIGSIPHQPNMPAQPTDPPSIALWALPFVPAIVQEALYDRQDRDPDPKSRPE